MSEQNGTSPATTDTPAAEDCVNCATTGEKVLAVLSIVFAVGLALMALDMFTGGRVTGYVSQARAGTGGND